MNQINSFLIFLLGKERFAFGVDWVSEVMEFTDITFLPQMPDYFKGIINLRGKVLPVIDLRAKLGLPAKEIDKRSRIIVLFNQSDEAELLGILVDSVTDVAELNATNIQTVSADHHLTETGFIKGMVQNDDGFIIMVDAGALIENSAIHLKTVVQTA
jgi:purine-binding chemotaxis protein CheW